MVIKSLDFRDHSFHPESVPGPTQPISISFNACHISLAHKSLNPFLDDCVVLLVFFWFTNHTFLQRIITQVSTIFNNAETLGAL